MKNAPIVTAVTRAREPIVTARMLAEGAHFNAVGAITPEREEFTQDVFARVDLIAVDMIESVKALSAEFRKRFGDGDWSSVHAALRSRRRESRSGRPRRGLDLVQGDGHGPVGSWRSASKS